MPHTHSRQWRSPLKTLVVALTMSAGSALVLANTANAAGGCDSSPQQCPSGMEWSDSKCKCVSKSSYLNDDELYRRGEQLALRGDYERAIEVLRSVSDQNTPAVLVYIGYSFRKMGQIDKGMRYYAKALAIDPNFVRAREYLGEGYVSAGRMNEAQDQLKEIGMRCGTGCEEYQELAQVITAAGGTVTIQ